MGKGGEVTPAYACGLVTLFIVLLTSVILLAVSFDTLTPLQAGVRYDNNRKKVDQSHVYANGRYFVGLGQSFIEFPINWRAMDFLKATNTPIRVWSREGQLVQLDVSMYWRFDREHLLDFYALYGEDAAKYDSIFRKIAVRSIKKITVQYEAVDFFLKRAEIREVMENELRTRFREEFVGVELFALRGIDLPDNFEDRIVTKVVTAQEVKTEAHIKSTGIALAEIDVILGKADASIKYLLANADADALKLVENTKSDGQRRIRELEGALYEQLQDALGLDAQHLLKLRWAQMTQTLEDNLGAERLNVMLGFQTPTIVA